MPFEFAPNTAEEIGSVINRMASTDNSEASDYFVEGVRYCGVCKKPKQFLLDLLGTERYVPIACDCELENARIQHEEDLNRDFKHTLWNMHNRFGLSDGVFPWMSFNADDCRNADVSAACRRYVEHWSEMKQYGIGIILNGPVGSGKSFYANAVLNALIDRRILAMGTNLSRIIDAFNSTTEKTELLDHLKRFSLLCIDDFGVERDTPTAIEHIFAVINARYLSRKPLIVTTNLSIQDMTECRNIKYRRVYDRILEMCPIQLTVQASASRRRESFGNRQAYAKQVLGL